MYRQELAKELASNITALKDIDLVEFCDKMEREVEYFETRFVSLFEQKPENTSKYPKVPIFDFKPHA